MRVLALDIGKVRTGIAVSDPQGRVASPVCVLATSELQSAGSAWHRLLQDWEPELLLAGLPYSLDGSETAQTKQARAIAEVVAAETKLSLAYTDERLSSAEAKRILHEEGYAEKEMRGKVDMIAASLFLQAWLDEQQSASRFEQPQETGTEGRS